MTPEKFVARVHSETRYDRRLTPIGQRQLNIPFPIIVGLTAAAVLLAPVIAKLVEAVFP